MSVNIKVVSSETFCVLVGLCLFSLLYARRGGKKEESGRDFFVLLLYLHMQPNTLPQCQHTFALGLVHLCVSHAAYSPVPAQKKRDWWNDNLLTNPSYVWSFCSCSQQTRWRKWASVGGRVTVNGKGPGTLKVCYYDSSLNFFHPSGAVVFPRQTSFFARTQCYNVPAVACSPIFRVSVDFRSP